MEARIGTLLVGTQFDTLLTGRRGVVRAHRVVDLSIDDGETTVKFTDQPAETVLHGRVRVRVVGVTH